ncbi:MAG: hypothetical protein WBA39_16285 [Rivularia sp. (in: cyanobacteria)]
MKRYYSLFYKAKSQLKKLKQAEKDLSIQKDQIFSKKAELQGVMKKQSALDQELGLV